MSHLPLKTEKLVVSRALAGATSPRLTAYSTTKGFATAMTSEVAQLASTSEAQSSPLSAKTSADLRELLVSMTPQQLADFLLED